MQRDKGEVALDRRTVTLSILGAAVVAACGGGGGGSAPAPAPSPGSGLPPPQPPAPPAAPSGSLALLAGTIGGTGTADGTGAAARLSALDLVFDADFNAYVLDQWAVRRITPFGVATTIRGAVFQSAQCIARTVGGTLYYGAAQAIYRFVPGGLSVPLAGMSGVPGGVDGTGTAARFGTIMGLVCDASGTLFAADGNGTVRRITPAGEVTTIAGLAGSYATVDGIGTSARFNVPTAIAIDGDTLFVADGATARRITPDGHVTTIAVAQPSLSSLTQVACDRRGSVYISGSLDRAIYRVSVNGGSVDRFAGGAGPADSIDGPRLDARLVQPGRIACDPSGQLAVLDNRCTLRLIRSDDRLVTVAGTASSRGWVDGVGASAQFDVAAGIAVDTAGRIYVADAGSHTVRRVDTDGTVTTIAGVAYQAGTADGPAGQARLTSPLRVVCDASGNVYVTCSGDHRIRRIATDGTVSTFTGASTPGAVDGLPADARFNAPLDMAFDAAGNLYVADRANYTLRRVAPDGIVSTVAGSTGLPGSDDGTGTAARFEIVTGMACDPAGNVYVTELGVVSSVRQLRRVTPQGVVSLVPSPAGLTDGGPVACNNGGTLYFARTHVSNTDGASGTTVYRVTPQGARAELAGRVDAQGVQLGALPASLNSVSALAVRPDGSLVIVSENAVLLLTLT